MVHWTVPGAATGYLVSSLEDIKARTVARPPPANHWPKNRVLHAIAHQIIPRQGRAAKMRIAGACESAPGVVPRAQEIIWIQSSLESTTGSVTPDCLAVELNV
jgi:hypothetical protein